MCTLDAACLMKPLLFSSACCQNDFHSIDLSRAIKSCNRTNNVVFRTLYQRCLFFCSARCWYHPNLPPPVGRWSGICPLAQDWAGRPPSCLYPGQQHRRHLVWVTCKLISASNPDPIVDRVQVWHVCRVQVQWSLVSRRRSSIVSRALCAGALSCCKMKKSPTCLIAGNISISRTFR